MGLLALLDGEQRLAHDDEPHEAPTLFDAPHELRRGAVELEHGDAATAERDVGHSLMDDRVEHRAQAQRLRGT
ncbi:hypothetical protein COEX109129_40795 [Corallococcus exiguus]